MHILGLDPGKVNFGYCLLEYKQQGSFYKYRIIKQGCLKNRITSLKSENFDLEYNAFIKEIKSIIKGVPNCSIRIERFQTRGFGGDLIELVSFMMGVIKASTSHKYSTITASQWKHWVNKSESLLEFVNDVSIKGKKRPTNLDKFYIKAKDYCSNHQLDATLIALFEVGQILNINPYLNFSKKDWSTLLLRIKNCK